MLGSIDFLLCECDLTWNRYCVVKYLLEDLVYIYFFHTRNRVTYQPLYHLRYSFKLCMKSFLLENTCYPESLGGSFVYWG